MSVVYDCLLLPTKHIQLLLLNNTKPTLNLFILYTHLCISLSVFIYFIFACILLKIDLGTIKEYRDKDKKDEHKENNQSNNSK